MLVDVRVESWLRAQLSTKPSMLLFVDVVLWIGLLSPAARADPGRKAGRFGGEDDWTLRCGTVCS